MPRRSRKPFRPGHYESSHRPDDRQQSERPKRDAYEWVVLWATIVGVAAAVIVAVISYFQASVMRQELESAIRQQRAWIRIDASEAQLQFGENGDVSIAANVTLTNVGAIPSNYVHTNSNLTPIPSLEHAHDAVNRLPVCPPIHIGGGYTLFPGESADLLEIAGNHVGAEEPREFIFTVCAYYDSGVGHLRGLTTARYYIAMHDGSRFSAEMGEVPPAKISMERHFDVEAAR